MDFTQLKVAVLAGGPGSERKISLRSAASVQEAISDKVGQSLLVDVTGSDFELPPGTDIAFNVIHGTYGEDGSLQAELERRGVPYTGAREVSSRLAFDKIKSKERFVAAGVSTPTSLVAMLDELDQGTVALPCVVKPPREGSSVGVSIVQDAAELEKALEEAAKYSPDILIESFIRGKELTVGVLGGEALPIVHIQPRSGFYDIKNKYPWLMADGGTDYFCPADLSDSVTQEVQRQALMAHNSLGIEVYSRVDVLLDGDEKPWVLEVNTIPGMTESSLLPKAAAAIGIDFATLCLKIIEFSLP